MTTYEVSDKYDADRGTVFLTGLQAIARLPIGQLRADIANGLDTAAFVSEYQGSPLGGLGEAVRAAARVADDLKIVTRPAMNEEYAASAVMGSQLVSTRPECRYDEVLGIWYGKAPGVDRAADALRQAVFAGTSRYGGAVAPVLGVSASCPEVAVTARAQVVADVAFAGGDGRRQSARLEGFAKR